MPQALGFDPRTAASGWRGLFRIEATSGLVSAVSASLEALHPQKVLFAEGDSWFDKFTPLGQSGSNLLDALRVPYLAAVVDASHIGDEMAEMVTGSQRRQTRTLLDLFAFDAILLSAAGNDLRALFEELFEDRTVAWTAEAIKALVFQGTHGPFFGRVIGHLAEFVKLREASRRNAGTPLFLHGYDYLQPRPAGAAVFANSAIGGGPWLYPMLRKANLDDRQMRAIADAVIDELNAQLAAFCRTHANVVYLDQRGLLLPAVPGSSGPSMDWLDEIHPDKEGFLKLARGRWDVPLASALGWQPQPGELVDAPAPTHASTAVAPGGSADDLFAGWQPPVA